MISHHCKIADGEGPHTGGRMSGKKSRFFPDAHCGTDRGLAVRPLRPSDAAFHTAAHALWNEPLDVLNSQRGEEQHAPECSAERRRALAGAGCDEQQSPSPRPCIPAAAACSAMITLAQVKSPAAEFNHHSMLT